MKALFDTNILVDYLNGITAAKTEIDRHGDRLISIVTWMEVLAGAHDDAEEDVIELFLRDFRIVDVSRRIAREALTIRRARRTRLPDAIIWATARIESALLVTRNTKDFPETDPGIRIPYTL
ncbi:MAG: type II toxin-antitoxin system VapC family toxin [Acidobacteriota bacterium]|nr:type II toxin-antitoxin system VapC family toxin [Acidobacteriota bacterium]